PILGGNEGSLATSPHRYRPRARPGVAGGGLSPLRGLPGGRGRLHDPPGGGPPGLRGGPPGQAPAPGRGPLEPGGARRRDAGPAGAAAGAGLRRTGLPLLAPGRPGGPGPGPPGPGLGRVPGGPPAAPAPVAPAAGAALPEEGAGGAGS